MRSPSALLSYIPEILAAVDFLLLKVIRTLKEKTTLNPVFLASVMRPLSRRGAIQGCIGSEPFQG